MGWERLTHKALTSAADSITTDTFAKKDLIKVVVCCIGTGQISGGGLQFNDDTGSNYSRKYESNGGSGASGTSESQLGMSGTIDSSGTMFHEYTIVNRDGDVKLLRGHTTISVNGASNAPDRREVAGKWSNYSSGVQIEKIKVINNGSGDFAAGSYITVLGAKEPATANVMTVDGGEDNTVTLSDDFSSDNFTNVGGQSGWGVSGGTMAWTTHRSTTHQGEYRALPSTVTGDFVLRFKLTNTTIAYDSSQEEYLYIGLSNSNSCASNTNQNVAGMYFHNYSSSDSKIQVTYRTNTSPFSGTATSIDFGENTTYYVEISKSDDTVTLKLFSDEDYSTLMSGGSASSTSGGASDQYTHIVLMGMYHSNAGSTSALGTIDNIKFYNGVSQVRKGFTAKKHLKIQVYTKGGNGNKFTFNNDTGNNYSHRYQLNGGSDGTQNSRANFWSYYDGNDVNKFTTIHVTNEASKEKPFITENVSATTTGAGTAPTRAETAGKWANTSNAITRFDASTFTTDGLEEGSEVIVWGSDGASDTTQPTIVNGFILEETDTGKHYIWNATTSTWTEIA